MADLDSAGILLQNLQVQQERSAADLKALMPAMLDRAFQGEL